jgi:hypothetical protein
MKRHTETSVTQRIDEIIPDFQLNSPSERIENDPEIQRLVAAIVSRSREPNDKLIELARDLASLRTHFERQYPDLGRTWYEWAREALFGVKDKNLLGLLNEIAESQAKGEPLGRQRAIVERHHRSGARRSREFRKRDRESKRHTENHFAELIKWSRTAEPAQLEHVKAGITRLIAEASRLRA